MILHIENGNRYMKRLAGENSYTKVTDVLEVELLQLIPGKKVWKKDNLQLRSSLPLLIHSQSSGKYWYRILREDHDLNLLRRYIKDGALYIVWDDDWKKKVREEVQRAGMGYFDLNKMRSLILLKEILNGQKDRPDIKIKTRAIEIQMDEIKNKYK